MKKNDCIIRCKDFLKCSVYTGEETFRYCPATAAAAGILMNFTTLYSTFPDWGIIHGYSSKKPQQAT